MLSTREAAELCGVSPATVRTYLWAGRFPPPDGYLGRSPWWSVETVLAWSASRRPPGRPAGGRGATGTP